MLTTSRSRRHRSNVRSASRQPASRQPAVRLQPPDVVDVFVYVVVLNLAIEYLPTVISESFTLSLLTAVLLKLTLEVVLVLKKRAVARFRGAMGVRAKLVAGLAVWLVAAGSKVAVLELVAVVFGDAVSLGGFVPVTALVVALLASRTAVRRLLATGSGATEVRGGHALGRDLRRRVLAARGLDPLPHAEDEQQPEDPHRDDGREGAAGGGGGHGGS